MSETMNTKTTAPEVREEDELLTSAKESRDAIAALGIDRPDVRVDDPQSAVNAIYRSGLSNSEIITMATEYLAKNTTSGNKVVQVLNKIGEVAAAARLGGGQASADLYQYINLPAWQHAEQSTVYSLFVNKMGKRKTHDFLTDLANNRLN